jgi:hypothetical protein
MAITLEKIVPKEYLDKVTKKNRLIDNPHIQKPMSGMNGKVTPQWHRPFDTDDALKLHTHHLHHNWTTNGTTRMLHGKEIRGRLRLFAPNISQWHRYFELVKVPKHFQMMFVCNGRFVIPHYVITQRMRIAEDELFKYLSKSILSDATADDVIKCETLQRHRKLATKPMAYWITLEDLHNIEKSGIFSRFYKKRWLNLYDWAIDCQEWLDHNYWLQTHKGTLLYGQFDLKAMLDNVLFVETERLEEFGDIRKQLTLTFLYYQTPLQPSHFMINGIKFELRFAHSFDPKILEQLYPKRKLRLFDGLAGPCKLPSNAY